MINTNNKAHKIKYLWAFDNNLKGNGVDFLNIIIEKNAAEYIKKHAKDDSITLYIHSAGGGWCSIQAPTVQLGKPDKDESFNMYSIDGVNVYIKEGIKVRNDQIRIFLRKFLWIKDLAVDGVRIDY